MQQTFVGIYQKNNRLYTETMVDSDLKTLKSQGKTLLALYVVPYEEVAGRLCATIRLLKPDQKVALLKYGLAERAGYFKTEYLYGIVNLLTAPETGLPPKLYKYLDELKLLRKK